MFNLAGAPKIVSQELYLENLRIPAGSSNKAIAESVIGHGKKKQVSILSCWVRRNKYVRDVVGCKITVPSTQANKCKVQPIWPEHVVCRDWFARHEIMGNSDQAPRFGRSFQDPPQDRRPRSWNGPRKPDRSFDLDGYNSRWPSQGRHDNYYKSYDEEDQYRSNNDYEGEPWSRERWDEFLSDENRTRD